MSASMYRAARHLRNGGLHKALNIGPDDDFSDEHLEKAGSSKNGHVAAMSDLVKRLKKASKNAEKIAKKEKKEGGK